MKKKFLVSILAICLCVISLLGLTACKDPLKMPENLSVTGQGGAVVRVGDYLYFTNGFVKTTDLKYGDNRKNITQGAIYRVKASVKDNAVLEYDSNGNMKGAEKVADNIAGFSSLNLFVYDNYIYYSTPLSTNDKQGNSQFGRTVIKKVKLNGEDSKELYTSESASPITWSVYKIEGQVVIGVLDGTNLVSVSSSGKGTTIAKNVSSVVFPMVNEYNPNSSSESTSLAQRQVYYTRTDDSVNGNAVYTANLKTAKESSEPVINANNGSEYKVVDFKEYALGGKIYYSITKDTLTHYFGTNVDSEGKVLIGNSSQTTQYTNLTYSDVEFSLSPRDEVIATYEYKKEDKTVKVLQLVDSEKTTTISEEELTVLAVKGDYIYAFNSNNELVKIGLSDSEHITTVIADFKNEKDDNDKEIEDGKDAFYSTGIATDKLEKSLFVDFDGDYMYFFRNFKNNDGKESIYLARVNLTTLNVETVGQMEENHKYTIQENSEQ